MNPARFSKLCRVALILITVAALILTVVYQPDAKAIQAAADITNMF